VVAVVMGGVGVGLGGIKFLNSGSDGQLLVWWPSLSHKAQGGGMRGGSGVVGSFFCCLPPVVAEGVGSMGGMGIEGVMTMNCHGESFLWDEGPSQVDVSTTLGLLTPYWVV
jgi:hypothetical protein